MYVEADISRVPAALVLHEADDFKSLKVVIHGPARRNDDLVDALAPLGFLDQDNNAMLDIDELKRLAGDRAGDPGWIASFDSMVTYARSRGWVGSGGSALQAHCDWYPEENE
jgi:hypothetical protein